MNDTTALISGIEFDLTKGTKRIWPQAVSNILFVLIMLIPLAAVLLIAIAPVIIITIVHRRVK